MKAVFASLKGFGLISSKSAGDSIPVPDSVSSGPDVIRTRLQGTVAGPYLFVTDAPLNLISVFDELRYDRSDGDYLSPLQRRHAVQKLAPLGFRQISGTVIENRAEDIRVIIPKFHALGASPFDATRHTPKRAQDYFLLTPTQTACRYIDSYDTQDAVERIKALIARQPINVLKIDDYLEDTAPHRAFREAIGHLKYVQREAISVEPLKGRRGPG